MSTQLLSTKLHFPPARPHLVARPRLTERLDIGVERKLTLLSASAGFGKTTLLAEWMQQRAADARPLAVAWLALDENDNDPTRFFTYLAAALQTLDEEIGKDVADLMRTSTPPAPEAIITLLINQVSAQPGPIMLILDDYHLITTPAIHEALAFLIDHLPAPMHLIIATRVDPPLPLSRLRGRDQLTEIRADDLRFTSDEATAFLTRVMGLGLTPADIAALEARTEGWIAGLHLAALSMRGQADVAGFIAAFTGSNRYILDYLIEEVLRGQPEASQSFLLQTSILDRLAAPLCNALTERTDSQAVLQALEQANLFIVPLDQDRTWYRYHHLFAEFLRARLHQLLPDRIAALHRCASAWYAQNGWPDDAIYHAVAAGDIEEAANLIRQHARAVLLRGEMVTLLRWLDALPETFAQAHPDLLVLRAWALLVSLRLDVADACLCDAERILNVEGGRAGSVLSSVASEIAAIRGIAASFRGDSRTATELAQYALEHLPEDDWFARSIAGFNLSIQYMITGDTAAAIQRLEETAWVGQRTGDVLVTPLVICQIAEQNMLQGKLRRTAQVYQQLLQQLTAQRRMPPPIAGLVYNGLAEVLREWNHLDAAVEHLRHGIELCESWQPIGALDGYITLAHTRHAQGDTQGAFQALTRAEQLAGQTSGMKMDDLLVAAHKARLDVRCGDLDAAIQWAQTRRLDAGRWQPSPHYYLREIEALTFVRLLLAQRRLDEALDLLGDLHRIATGLERDGIRIQVETLQALAHAAQGNLAQAAALLEQALARAGSEGYVRTFLDEGSAMRPILERVKVGSSATKGYARTLLAALEGAEGARSALPLGGPLIEPLSDRELQVLRFIADGRSNQEIADRLVVALSTVKTHINNIYAKLGVEGRVQAVNRARELGLV